MYRPTDSECDEQRICGKGVRLYEGVLVVVNVFQEGAD